MGVSFDILDVKEKLCYFRIFSDSARERASVFIVLNRQSLISEKLFWQLKNGIREITSMLKGFSR